MKLAVIGLGDIAQKAYLPVYAERSDIEVHLISRDEEKAKRLQSAYRFAGTYATFEDAVQAGIDAVMIHSATIVHAEQARQALEAGIAVYVDKAGLDGNRRDSSTDTSIGRETVTVHHWIQSTLRISASTIA
ncbi:Gfo/Idh/MocA family oxidoreductase [Exiguobacterium sp. SL14]|nr:Gfo/Idh/MocA family oxidoreductase [Exiguobacterium sp. SL14]MCY1689995.1 Gfo/Idh/MocA family oxidoreductase [Exiguobacterium sp. SL14]